MSTLRGSYGKSKGRSAQARTKSASRFWAPAFSCAFPHKVALVKCPSSFRLSRLAQSVGCDRGMAHRWGWDAVGVGWDVNVHWQANQQRHTGGGWGGVG